MRPVELQLPGLSLEGWSRAGDETWFRVHPPGLAIDTGRGALQLAGAADVFVSHGHLDHALGLPFVLSQRSLHRGASTRVFCPREIASPLADLVAAAERLEGVGYTWELVPLAAGDRAEVGRDFLLEPFATDHVVPTLGVHLIRRKRRLAPHLAGVPGPELAAMRARGEEPSEVVEELAFSYAGDTGPGVFEREPRLFTTPVLLLECTFLRDEHRRRGDRYKHLHITDLAERAASFRNQAVVLHHLSRRHSVAELREAVARHLPELAPRVHLLVEAT
jgi:ribonuclease Z